MEIWCVDPCSTGIIKLIFVDGGVLILPLSDRGASDPLTLIDQEPPPLFKFIQQQLANLYRKL